MPRTETFRFKSGETRRKIPYQITDIDGNPEDLSNVTSVTFSMDGPDGSSVVTDASATTEDATNGEVSYQLSSGDTGTTGIHTAEFRVEFQAGSDVIYPRFADLEIHVKEPVN